MSVKILANNLLLNFNLHVSNQHDQYFCQNNFVRNPLPNKADKEFLFELIKNLL